MVNINNTIENMWNDQQLPLVSVIVVTYNSSKYVIETLESVRFQTYLNIEIIVCDDCSMDDTVEICRRWMDDNKIRFNKTLLITVEKNTGTPANCNRGLNAAQGGWIKFVAGDDALMPDCIKDNMLFIESNREIKIVQSECEAYKRTFDSGNFICNSNLRANLLYKEGISANEQYSILLKRNCVLAAAIFVKKSIIHELGGYDEDFRIIEDLPMWLKITKENIKIYLLHKTTVKYRISDSSVMKDGKPFTPEKYAKELMYFFKKYKKERSAGNFYHYSSLFGITLIIFFNRIKMNNNSIISRYLFKSAYFFLYLGRRKYRIVFN
jgi:glycosyltransferase involved in cell wall biosynthesis